VSGFSATTMSNLAADTSSAIYWIHLIFSFSILPGTLLFMRLFYKHIEKTCDIRTAQSSRTLILSGLAKKMRNESAIRNFFRKVYPGCRITNIKVNLKISFLSDLETHFYEFEDIVKEIRNSGSTDTERLFKLNFLSSFSACFSLPETPLAIIYYEKKMMRIKNQLTAAAAKIYNKSKKLNSAFVQIDNADMARLIGEQWA
jgi:hypothetical protein